MGRQRLLPGSSPVKPLVRAQANAALQELDLVVTEEQFMDDEALNDPSQGMASCVDTMMTMILELFQNVIQARMRQYKKMPPAQVYLDTR